MFSVRKLRVIPTWWMSLAVIAVWIVPVPVRGQALPKSRPESATVNQQFANIDESLTRKADTLLGSDGRNASAGAVTTPTAGVSGASRIVPIQQQPGKRYGFGAAAARLELLRPSITPILERERIPVELAAIILVESGGDAMALSPKGARGLWQLMPETARRYGLVVDGTRDERLDIEKSTRAAARYLNDLYLEFRSWPLALAAYNTGEQNLQRAIDRSRSTEFSVLSSLGLLPAETRNYVPAVMAAIRSSSQATLFGEYRPISNTRTVFAPSSQ